MATIGSLFAGIGGLELGLEWAGLGHTIWQVERDPFARKILAKHWPDAARYDDVCSVGAHNLSPVDVICGGFPCQDLSYAGKGAGLAGERSGLWREYARIIRELRPCIVVVENVAALLARGLGDVLGDLAALGYDAWWDCIPASAVGAPHQRDRLFVVGLALPVSRGDAWPGSGERSRALGYTDGPRLEKRRSIAGDTRAQRAPAQRADRSRAVRASFGGLGRAAHGLPRGLDGRWPASPGEEQHSWEASRTAQGQANRPTRLKALGNAVVPQVGYVIGCAIRDLRGCS